MNSHILEMEQKLHVPVMLEKIIAYLALRPGKVIVDCTIGTAGHSEAILERISPGGRLIGIDRDSGTLEIAKARLEKFSSSYELVYGNFTDLDSILAQCRIKSVDGILFDLGISSFQLQSPERGFSFQNDGPLDMRMDRNSYISAYDLINNLNEEEISMLLWNFGQERWHNRIARFLVKERKLHPIATTQELSQIVIRAVPGKYRYSRIHPATRTFQAVRIAVNRELEMLASALDKSVELLARGARLCVISFHSLEDRIVKLKFREFASKGLVEIITPKPIVPESAETIHNPSSRSSKLRVAERK